MTGSCTHSPFNHAVFPACVLNVHVPTSQLDQVLKYSPAHELLLTLGEAFTPGSDAHHFCKPTGVAVGWNGEIFVADG
jgi:hypothetical protein